MKLIYGVKDKPAFKDVLVFAFQQLLAIMAATIAVPAIVGNGMTASAALFGAGVGTIVYQLFTRFRSPVFLGSSFAFLGSMFAAFGGAASMEVGLQLYVPSMTVNRAVRSTSERPAPGRNADNAVSAASSGTPKRCATASAASAFCTLCFPATCSVTGRRFPNSSAVKDTPDSPFSVRSTARTSTPSDKPYVIAPGIVRSRSSSPFATTVPFGRR